jgi:hypothetical protein
VGEAYLWKYAVDRGILEGSAVTMALRQFKQTVSKRRRRMP